MSTEESNAIVFDGGSEEDQRALLEAFRAFWRANNYLDIPALKELWREDPDYRFFNSNGFNYRGLEDWLGIWRYYGPRFRCIEEAELGDVRVMIRGDMALVTDDGVHRLFEVLNEDPSGHPIASHPVMRATMVYTREDDGWRVVHTHYSPAAIEGDRPWAPEEGKGKE